MITRIKYSVKLNCREISAASDSRLGSTVFLVNDKVAEHEEHDDLKAEGAERRPHPLSASAPLESGRRITRCDVGHHDAVCIEREPGKRTTM